LLVLRRSAAPRAGIAMNPPVAPGQRAPLLRTPAQVALVRGELGRGEVGM
jgi:hypothetical protein